MQVGVVVDILQRLGHRRAHAVLVDVAHVEHAQAQRANGFLLVAVHAADADEADGVVLQRRALAAPAREHGRPVAQQA